MAKSKTTAVPANRFKSQSVAKIGSSDLAPGRYIKRDQYGYHFRRVLADGQYIDYTVTQAGFLIEKTNFIPSKNRRDGNGEYGNRWAGILEYRQSADHADDLRHAAENGMVMEPPAKAGKPGNSEWTQES